MGGQMGGMAAGVDIEYRWCGIVASLAKASMPKGGASLTAGLRGDVRGALPFVLWSLVYQ